MRWALFLKHRTNQLCMPVGDTMWTSDVDKALHRFDPNVIIMNTGYAQILRL